MKYTPEQRHQCVCKIVPIIAKYEGWEMDEDTVALALNLGGTRNIRLERWIALAELLLNEIQEKVLSEYEKQI